MSSSFQFKTTPYEHQSMVFDRIKDERFYALFCEMGTGKSKMAIDYGCYKAYTGEIEHIFIIAPKGIYMNWVRKEIPVHCGLNYVVFSNKGRKIEKVAEVGEKPDVTFYVINTESFSQAATARVMSELINKFGNRALVILDESTTIKNPKSNRTKNLLNLTKYTKHRLILSGFSVVNSPLDVYSQMAFLHPGILGFKSFFAFRNRYAQMQQVILGNRRFNKVTGYQNLEELQAKLKPYSIKLKKEDCLDLPPKTYIEREFELGKEQKTYYDQMQDMLMVFTSEEDNADPIAEVNNVLAKMIKLKQLSCGYVQDDEGIIHKIGEKNARLDALMSALEETSGKVIIWSDLVPAIEDIYEAIAKEYGANTVAAYYGKTKDSERPELCAKFQDPDSELRFMIVNPATGAWGLTLTESSTCIYYTNSYNLEHRVQSEDRIHRIGQKSEFVNYIDLVGKGTLDRKIAKALKEKKNLEKLLMSGDYRQWLLD